MDESWRMRIGIPTATASTETTTLKPNLPPRRSTEETRNPNSDNTLLEPEDFNDVFGGPPRTVLSRQFSNGPDFSRPLSSTGLFYEEMFRRPEKAGSASERSRYNLPEFRIPADREGQQRSQFYSDIFGWEEEMVMRSRTRSKTSSSSALSSEDLSPLQPAFIVDGDNEVSFFASKLRPINVGSRWTSTRRVQEHYLKQKISIPIFGGCNPSMCSPENDNIRTSPFEFRRKNSSPETISLEPTSIRVSTETTELNSPSSTFSSVCEEPHDKADETFQQHETEQEEGDDDMSSYVIEINSDHREEMYNAIGVDEAIAFAKEKFKTHCPENNSTTQELVKEPSQEEILDEPPPDGVGASTQGKPVETKTQLLDEKIRLWSTGKEAEIRLLLSTLHHILWPESGWVMTPLSSLINSCQVKKAYQRAQLCLHPDKVQQRGATIPQKYVAEKVFSILQDAWAAFVSKDVPCRR